MFDALETEHLILRKAKDSDLENIWKNIWSDGEISKTMLWQVNETLEDARDRLQRTMEYQKDHYAYFVCLKENDEAIGFAGIKEVLPNEWAESGICIARKCQNKGFAKEVVGALKKLVFDGIHGRRFFYSCFHENEISKRVCLSCGFQFYESQEHVREWDQYKHISDVYYFDSEMWKEENKMNENIELEPLFEEYVDFDTFSKSDFRVVKIKECIAVPKSKKLLQFTLDDGTGVDRTILSGIHAYYEPEELVGKNVVAILNLPPRNMMGIDSCGMLMSAVYKVDGEERLHLMIVDDSIPAGAKLY